MNPSNPCARTLLIVICITALCGKGYGYVTVPH